jgi:hypothetical protein
MDAEERRDQTLHVVVFGVFATIHPALGAAAVACYELADWHLDVGAITIAQWPPKGYKPERVEDLRTDLIYELAGVAVGSVLHSVWTIALAIWLAT